MYNSHILLLDLTYGRTMLIAMATSLDRSRNIYTNMSTTPKICWRSVF